jgi:hypothetical protein
VGLEPVKIDEALTKCDAVLRLRGKSPGADREEAAARAAGIPVFHKFTALAEWARGGP